MLGYVISSPYDICTDCIIVDCTIYASPRLTNSSGCYGEGGLNFVGLQRGPKCSEYLPSAPWSSHLRPPPRSPI